MAKRSKAKTTAKGRSLNPTDRFSRLPHGIQNSPAYRALSPTARALLLEIISLENGQNNGLLYLSERDAAARIGVKSEKTARGAFSELSKTGLIVCAGNAYFDIKAGDGRARRWALSWLFDYANKIPASNAWKSYRQSGEVAHRVAAGMKALKRYKRKPMPDNDDYQSIHAGIFFPFDRENGKVAANCRQANLTASNSETAENRQFLDVTRQANLTDYTAVTMGKVQPARWEERPRPSGGKRQYLLVA